MFAKSVTPLTLLLAGVSAGCSMYASRHNLAITPSLPNLPAHTKKSLDDKKAIYSVSDWNKFNLVVAESLKHAEGQQKPTDENGNKLEILRVTFPTYIKDSKGFKVEMQGYDRAHQMLRLFQGQSAQNLTQRDPNMDPTRVSIVTEGLVHKIYKAAEEKVGK